MRSLSIAAMVLVLAGCLIWVWFHQLGTDESNPAQPDFSGSLTTPAVPDAILEVQSSKDAVQEQDLLTPLPSKTSPGEFELRSQSFDIPFQVQDIGKAFLRGETDSLSFPLFDGEAVMIALQYYRSPNAATGSLLGKVQGQDLSHVVITQYEGAWAGTIQMPEIGLFYEIRNGSAPGTYLLLQVNPEVLTLTPPLVKPEVLTVPVTLDQPIP